ncbi:GYF domain protein [Aspergillus luchuensis]|uniref:GYF domain protein n=1 Tax=Aspergillus kawachii TaxID=1069201 RepID=A0A146FRX5_ASPKA|nr:GYF domain protein [Aspergillus luchuensis]
MPGQVADLRATNRASHILPRCANLGSQSSSSPTATGRLEDDKGQTL